VTDDDRVRGHRLKVLGGVDQRFALADRRSRSGDIDRVRREALCGNLERRASTRGRFEEEIDYRLATKGGDFFDRASGNLFERLGRVEDGVDILD